MGGRDAGRADLSGTMEGGAAVRDLGAGREEERMRKRRSGLVGPLQNFVCILKFKIYVL